MKNSVLYKRITGFISVVLAIWVADSMVKQIGFLSGLNNLWGMILVAGIIYVVEEYFIDMVNKKN